jgi:hypothetical protein
MNKREAAIITAYTGIMIGSFSDFHRYAEEIIGRPVFTHEFGTREILEQIKEKSRQDFINLKVVEG